MKLKKQGLILLIKSVEITLAMATLSIFCLRVLSAVPTGVAKMKKTKKSV